jgi:hypothetical protein
MSKRPVEDLEDSSTKKKKLCQNLNLTVQLSENQQILRVIRIGIHESFEVLATAISDSFEYPRNQFYSFHMDGVEYSAKHPYFSKVLAKQPDASTSLLSAEDWSATKSFLFVYDYSDPVNFLITVDSVSRTQ